MGKGFIRFSDVPPPPPPPSSPFPGGKSQTSVSRGPGRDTGSIPDKSWDAAPPPQTPSRGETHPFPAGPARLSLPFLSPPRPAAAAEPALPPPGLRGKRRGGWGWGGKPRFTPRGTVVGVVGAARGAGLVFLGSGGKEQPEHSPVWWLKPTTTPPHHGGPVSPLPRTPTPPPPNTETLGVRCKSSYFLTLASPPRSRSPPPAPGPAPSTHGRAAAGRGTGPCVKPKGAVANFQTGGLPSPRGGSEGSPRGKAHGWQHQPQNCSISSLYTSA